MARKILVLDNEENIRDIVSRSLRREGYETLEADNGYRALELLGSENPAAVITDFVRPEMSGYDFAKLAREAGYQGTILMASADVETVKSLFPDADKYFAGYISKPFSLEQLKEFVKSKVGLSQEQ